jgi:tetratricopeptide (TPR) repeat protein
MNYYNRGLSQIKLENYAAAISDFDKVILLNPTYFKAYLKRGNTKHSMGNLEGALVDLNKGIEMEPTYPVGYKYRAMIYLDKKEKTIACENLEQARKLGYEERFGNAVNQLIMKNCFE